MPRAIRIEQHRSIRVSQQRVFQLLSRIESLPRYNALWLAADVMERSGQQVVAEFRGYLGGLPIESIQRLTVRPPGRLEFRQIRGTLKALRGEYVVESEGEDARLVARVEIDAGIPMLDERAVRTAIAVSVERMLGKVKDAAERDLPRLIVRRVAGPAPGSGHPASATLAGDGAVSVDGVASDSMLGDTAEPPAAPLPERAVPEERVGGQPRPRAAAEPQGADGARKSQQSRRRRRRRRRGRRPQAPPGASPGGGR